MTSTTVSADDIKAAMPHQTLTRILGEPSHQHIANLKREVYRNLQSVSCPWGHNKGFTGLLQPIGEYTAAKGAAFTIPAIPPDYPVVPQAANANVRAELVAKNTILRKDYHTYELVVTIVRNQIAAAVDRAYYVLGFYGRFR